MLTPKTDELGLHSCQRCGACLSVCPVYGETRLETVSPRGKIELIRQGKTSAGSVALHSCLLCGRCTEACPSAVSVHELIHNSIVSLHESGEAPLWKRVAIQALENPKRLQHVLRFLKGTQSLLTQKNIPEDSGLRLRFIFSDGGREKYLPFPAKRFLSQILDEQPVRSANTEGLAITFFTGCSFQYVEPQAARGIISALAEAGHQVTVPANQGCCGLPAFGAGDVESARKLAQRNMELLLAGDPSMVAVPCASCMYMLGIQYPKLFPEGPSHEIAMRLSGKIIDLHELMARQCPLSESGQSPAQPLRVTFHDPCHMSIGMGMRAQPRELIGKLDHVRLVEMDGADLCCGGGGSFAVARRKLSAAIGHRKATDILNSGAEAVVTSCPGCMFQIRDALAKAGSALPVLHTLELINPGVVQRVRCKQPMVQS